MPLPLLIVLGQAFGQTYAISTFAGGLMPANSPATPASIGSVTGVAVDSMGNVFLASGSLNAVLRLDVKTGLLSVVAGNGTQGFSGDNGPAASAQLSLPVGVAVDSAGTLYIADSGNNRIRKVSNGVITTVAVTGALATSGMATFDAGPAMIYSPSGIAVDTAGNLYLSDSLHSRILKVSNGVTTTVAGNGTSGFSGDNGPAASAQLSAPYGVAVDSAGNLFIADTGNNRIRRVSNGVITTLAGSGAANSGVDSGNNGPAVDAVLNNPWYVAVDLAGNVYFSESDFPPAQIGNAFALVSHHSIRMVANGIISLAAGDGTQGFGGDNGPAAIAQLDYPGVVAVDSAGNLYIADQANNRIRKVSNGVITTVAGNGTQGFSGDGGAATSAELFLGGFAGIAVDSSGNLYFADGGNNRIRRVTNGVITTVAGNGTRGFSGDNGPATSAGLFDPSGLAVDSVGNLYFADSGNNRIRKVTNGVITTVAGNGTPGFSGDNGPAASAGLYAPIGVAADSAGNLYIADHANGRIRKVSNGVITTVAGSGMGVITIVAGSGMAGFVGDNGPATSAELYYPNAVAVDAGGNLYIVDSDRVCKVSNGVITTVAGNGTSGASGDYGAATSAAFFQPSAVAVDSAGSVYIADSGNNRVRVLIPTGSSTPPMITSVTNAASNLAGSIALGEIVVLSGLGLGPAQITSASVGGDGLYDAQWSGTSVKFNGTPAPILYTWAGQIGAIVPYEVTGSTAQVTVAYQGQTSGPLTVAVAGSAPGLFTLNSTGWGQAAAVNQDGSINTALTPAPIGSFISLYATGEGQTSPAGIDGKPASDFPPAPVLPVSVTIGGVTVSNLQYAGGAPGEVSGMLQINVQIPGGVQAGSTVPVSVQIGSASSRGGVTIAVGGS